MLFNCTEASADRILPELEEMLASTEDEQAQWFLTVFKREWERNRGKGFVEFDFGDMVSDTFVKGIQTSFLGHRLGGCLLRQFG